jgi:hypothetical protein
MNAQDTLCTAAFSIDNSELMHLQLDAAMTDTNATYSWYTDGAFIADGASTNVLLYPGIREICLHVESPTCIADSCIWADVLCTNNTIKFKITSYGDSTGTSDTLNIMATNALLEVFSYTGFTLSPNQYIEWLECIDETIDCVSLVITPQTWWQLNADSITIEAEYISGGDGPILLQLYSNPDISHNYGELLGIECIWYSVENQEQEPLHVWPNPATDVLHFATAPDAIRLIDFSGKLIFEKTVKTERLELEHLPSGIYAIQARYGNVWKTARVMKY